MEPGIHVPDAGSTEELSVVDHEQTKSSSPSGAPPTRKSSKPKEAPKPGTDVDTAVVKQTAIDPSTMIRVVKNVGRLAASSGRDDLAKRLDQTRSRLLDP